MATRLVAAGAAPLIVALAWTIGSIAAGAGQRVYDDKCSQCHGAEGRGGKGPRLVPFEWTYQQALQQIRQPLCDMPPMPASEVSDEEVAQIVEYLKAIK
jgi:cytochrome c oxidase cbb3-type subunit III